MTLDEFWHLVDRVHVAAPRDMDAKCKLLERELSLLPLAEVRSFAHHFHECYLRANHWDLWGAAYIIGHGCGDDSFMDFRATLISMGRTIFEAAISNAESLADVDLDPDQMMYEGYQSVAAQVCVQHYNYDPSDEPLDPRFSQGPRGEPFEEEEMTPRFPRLVAKHNYLDTDPTVLKAQRQRRAESEILSERVKEILVNGIIPRSGHIPPPRIVRQILPQGHAPTASGLIHQWSPFELDEGNFWTALSRLKSLTPDDLKTRPDLVGKSLTLDTDCGDVKEYDEWITSLRKRGYL